MGSRWSGIWRYAVLTGIAIVMGLPFLWMVLTSLKPNADIFHVPFEFWPHHVTLIHYVHAFRDAPWGRYFFNSAFTAVVATCGQVIFASMAGYAFGRLRFPLRNVLFLFLLSGIMVPVEVTLVPLFVIIQHFPLVGGNNLFGHGGTGLINTYGALIIPNLVAVFGVFLMRQFFASLPVSLEEAARIDGCGELKIFTHIMLPLVRPAMITVAIFGFTGMWDSFLWPLIALSKSSLFTVQLGLASLSGGPTGTTDWGALLAATVVITVPMFIVFLVLQRYFIEGIVLSGVKG